RPRLADYVTGMKPTRGATAAGGGEGANVGYPLCRRLLGGCGRRACAGGSWAARGRGWQITSRE
ncbi:MAG TPA: hypothetical protein VLA89_09440, partial [Gemmatimonadales bacterium]|nr:hypothetical protein [Gemmatimonadales bacterium]